MMITWIPYSGYGTMEQRERPPRNESFTLRFVTKFLLQIDQTKCFENNEVDVTILSLSFLFLCTIRMLRLACLCWQGHLPSLILTARHISTLYSSVQDACKGGCLAVGLWAGWRASDIPGSDVPVLSLVQLENMPAVVGHNAQTVTCLFFVGAGDHSKSEPAQ